MTCVWMSGFEVAVTEDTTEWGSGHVTTNFSLDTTTVNPGLGRQSGKFTSGTSYLYSGGGDWGLTKAWWRFYVRFDDVPNAGPALGGFKNAAGDNWLYFNTTNGGLIQMVEGSGVVLLTAPIPVVAGTWHRLELFCDITDGASGAAARIDGTPFDGDGGITAVSYAAATGTIDKINIGSAGTFGTTVRYDDVKVNSPDGWSDCSWCGPGTIGAVFPYADGSVLQWTAHNGGTHEAELDEMEDGTTEPDDATSYITMNPGVFGNEDYIYMTPLPEGVVAKTWMLGIRGGGTAVADGSTRCQLLDTNFVAMLGTYPGISIETNWNLNGWKTVYPTLVVPTQGGGGLQMLTGNYLNTSLVRMIRVDTESNEVRITALWANVDAIVPGLPEPSTIRRDQPRMLIELGPPSTET